MDIAVEDDFVGLWDQKSSYQHVSDFGRLRNYGSRVRIIEINETK